MQQLGCESHSVTCVSCYVHVYGNKVIIIIIILTQYSWTRPLRRQESTQRYEELFKPSLRQPLEWFA